MDLGAPISDVELAVVVSEEPAAESGTSDTSGGTDSSSSSSDSSSNSGSKQKIITGGQVTAPGFDPIILNMDAYWKPQLLRSKNEDYDAKALRLA